MKKINLRNILIELTPQETAKINGGRRGRGADDGPGHVRGGGLDDGPGHT